MDIFYGSNNWNIANSGNEYINISERDRISIELLKLLILSNYISLASLILSIKAANNGIETILERYSKVNKDIYNPDLLALYSIYLGIISRLIVTKVGLDKGKLAYNDYKNGAENIDLSSFREINNSNFISLLGNLIGLEVAEQVYERNGLNIFV